MMDTSLIYNILINGFTLVSKERLMNLYEKCSMFRDTDYSFVECGVAKGGCIALMKSIAGKNTKVFGFDSFEGMPEITSKDISSYNKSDIINGFGKPVTIYLEE